MEAANRPSRQERGYNAEYERARREMIEFAWYHKLPCCLCGQAFKSMSEITAEHIKAKRHGGTNQASNLGPAHKRCNSAWQRWQAVKRSQA